MAQQVVATRELERADVALVCSRAVNELVLFQVLLGAETLATRFAHERR